MKTGLEAAAAAAVAPAAGVLEAVFRDRYTALVAVARLLVDERADAEEVVQEAFARTYARAPELPTAPEAAAYVQRAVVNLSRDTLRRRRIARRLPPPPAARAPGADRAVLLDDDQRRVTGA